MIEKTLKLYIRPDSDKADGFKYYLADPDTYHSPWDEDIKIGEVKVSFWPPDNLNENQLRLKAIETLRDKQKQIRAKAERDVQMLQQKIDNMLLLTHQPPEGTIEGESVTVQ